MAKNTLARDLAFAAIGLVVLLCVPLLGSKAATNFIIYVSANGLLAMSLNLLVGYTGLVSFGHAMFFGAAGAYPFVLLMQNLPIGLPTGIVLTLVFAAVLALAIGAICVRLTEIYFSFLTLAFQMLIYSLMMNLVEYTGGDNGLSGIPRPPFLGINLADGATFYVFACTVFVIALVILRIIVMSPFGYTLRLIRDNAQRATFLGVNVMRTKLICFVLAGVFASLGGIIMALFAAGAFPSFSFWTNSGDAIFMIMLGGLHVFLGPVLGAVILQVLNDVVTHYTKHYGLFLGLLILTIVLGFRKGLLDFIYDRREAREQSALSAARKKAQD